MDLDDETWVKDAACEGLGHIMFHHECTDACQRSIKGKRRCDEVDETVCKARDICNSCPVQRECLTFVLLTGVNHGIAGGFTEIERKLMRKELRLRKFQIRTHRAKAAPKLEDLGHIAVSFGSAGRNPDVDALMDRAESKFHYPSGGH